MYRLPPAVFSCCGNSVNRLEIVLNNSISGILQKTESKNIQNSWNANTSSARRPPKKWSQHKPIDFVSTFITRMKKLVIFWTFYYWEPYWKLVCGWDHFLGRGRAEDVFAFHEFWIFFDSVFCKMPEMIKIQLFQRDCSIKVNTVKTGTIRFISCGVGATYWGVGANLLRFWQWVTSEFVALQYINAKIL